VCGVPLPEGLRNASKLPTPIYTPAAKAAAGEHDENITFERTVEMIGRRSGQPHPRHQHRLYKAAADIALPRASSLPTPSSSLGWTRRHPLVLMDEVLTPDSSRYWPAESYVEGVNPPSYDKQFLRDWLEQVQVNGKPWEQEPPAPHLPREVIDKTAEKYQEALQRLTA
jgi:phosphoribosylaminoimidazole-succinocarboxamide synthase